MNYTEHLNLKKPELTELASIADINSNADILDATVGGLLTEINTPDNNSVTLTPTTQSITVTDSYAAPADTAVGGTSLVNSVVNGDFANGTTGWGFEFASIAFSNKVLSITGNGTVAELEAIQNTNMSAKTGDKVFLCARVRAVSYTPVLLFLQLRRTDNAYIETTVQIATPAPSVWYTAGGITTIGAVAGLIQIRAGAVYADAATANGKVMEVDGNAGVFAIHMTGTPYENYTAEQMLALVKGGYFEGLQSTQKIGVTGRGRNLFDEQLEAGAYSTTSGVKYGLPGYMRSVKRIPVKPNTTYTIKAVGAGEVGVLAYTNYDLSSFTGTMTNVAAGQSSFTTPANTKYVAFYLMSTDTAHPVTLTESNTAPTEYIPYEGATASVVCNTPSAFSLAKLPNGVQNTIEYKDGKWVAVKRVAEKVLAAGDITAMHTTYVNLDYTKILRPSDWKYATAAVNSQTSAIAGGYKETVADYDNANKVGTVDFQADNVAIWVGFAKGTTLAAAQAALAGTKILYQLATPVTIEEKDFATYGITVSGGLSSNIDYTEFIVSDYDMLPPVSVSYATNLAQAVQDSKEAIAGVRAAVDGKASKVQEPWITPTLLNGWVNYGVGLDTISYMKDDLGFVHFKGTIKSGSSNTPFVLPVAYRPSAINLFSCAKSDGTVAIEIYPDDGAVSIPPGSLPGSAVSTSFDGITFRAEG